MLGADLLAVLGESADKVSAPPRSELDITDQAAVDAAVPGHDVVVNLAAWTDVDGAESAEEEAYLANAVGPAALARACARAGARLVQLSTDYVFDGAASTPYDEDAPTNPVNAYGRTKRAGERAVLELNTDASFVVRTSWLYGANGRSFVTTMARLSGERETVDVVSDQHGQPTWTRDVARQVVNLMHSDAPPGIYHATSSGETTWFGLAAAVFEELGLDPGRVHAVDSTRFPRPAARPAYSVLGHGRWTEVGMRPLRGWREALTAAIPSVVAHPRSAE
jgi:dTDP-4-dehydrorhamnose reductase